MSPTFKLHFLILTLSKKESHPTFIPSRTSQSWGHIIWDTLYARALTQWISMVALPSPAKYTEWREEREAANTVFSDPVRTITTAGGNSLSLSPALECGNEPGELERVTRQGETRRASSPRSAEASICFLLHNTLIVLELIFSRDKKYILN